MIVVDDGSTDGTARPLGVAAGATTSSSSARPNRGKGAAIRAAIPHIDGDIVVIQDADMEYDPADVPALIEPIQRGAADVVYGSRLRAAGRSARTSSGTSWATGSCPAHERPLQHDAHGHGDRVQGVSRRSAAPARPAQDDFAIEPEITGKVCKRNLRIYELPIAYYGRTYAEGKKITWRDGFKAVWVLLAVRVSWLSAAGWTGTIERSTRRSATRSSFRPTTSRETLPELRGRG